MKWWSKHTRAISRITAIYLLRIRIRNVVAAAIQVLVSHGGCRICRPLGWFSLGCLGCCWPKLWKRCCYRCYQNASSWGARAAARKCWKKAMLCQAWWIVLDGTKSPSSSSSSMHQLPNLSKMNRNNHKQSAGWASSGCLRRMNNNDLPFLWKMGGQSCFFPS